MLCIWLRCFKHLPSVMKFLPLWCRLEQTKYGHHNRYYFLSGALHKNCSVFTGEPFLFLKTFQHTLAFNSTAVLQSTVIDKLSIHFNQCVVVFFIIFLLNELLYVHVLTSVIYCVGPRKQLYNSMIIIFVVLLLLALHVSLPLLYYY